MRQRNWLLALILCAGMLFALAQTAWAEPDETLPDDIPVADTSIEDTTEVTTTKKPRSTYDWEAITDEHGVTVYPPPPDVDVTAAESTTTAKKTARTQSDDYRNAPYRPIPGLYDVVTDEYGNVITLPVAETTTAETTTESTEETTFDEEFLLDEPGSPKSSIHWAIAAVAGAVLLAAAAGGVIVVRKGRKDGDDDDYIYEEPEPPETET